MKTLAFQWQKLAKWQIYMDNFSICVMISINLLSNLETKKLEPKLVNMNLIFSMDYLVLNKGSMFNFIVSNKQI